MNRVRSLLIAALAVVIWPLQASANDSILERWPEGGHIRVQDSRGLAPEDAEKIYDALLDRMIADYAKSGLDNIDYSAWRRLNTAPYISDQHGARFVNVYINGAAGDFFTASAEAPLPVGSVVEFCGECHVQVADRDHLFKLPEEYLKN